MKEEVPTSTACAANTAPPLPFAVTLVNVEPWTAARPTAATAPPLPVREAVPLNVLARTVASTAANTAPPSSVAFTWENWESTTVTRSPCTAPPVVAAVQSERELPVTETSLAEKAQPPDAEREAAEANVEVDTVRFVVAATAPPSRREVALAKVLPEQARAAAERAAPPRPAGALVLVKNELAIVNVTLPKTAPPPFGRHERARTPRTGWVGVHNETTA